MCPETGEEKNDIAHLPLVHLSYSRENRAEAELAYKIAIEPLVTSARVCATGIDTPLTTVDISNSVSFVVIIVSPVYLADPARLEQLVALQKAGQVRLVPLIIEPIERFPQSLSYQPNLPGNGRAMSDLDPEEKGRIWRDLNGLLASWIQRYEVQQERKKKSILPGKPVTMPKPGQQKPVATEADFFFISHSSDDYDFAQNLKNKLESNNLQAWIDDDRLDPGVEWKKEIDDSIRKSMGVILVVSPKATESGYVTYEWSFARGLDLPIIPLVLKQATMHPRLADFQCMSFDTPRSRPWDSLIECLKIIENNHK